MQPLALSAIAVTAIVLFRTPNPGFIKLDNVLTVERQGDLTTVVMLGGETIYVDTMPETLIGGVAPAGPV